MEELKVGDRVKIADDSPLARRILKESNAGDGPYKWYCFGKIGTISQSWTVNGNFAVTMDDGNEYSWPPILLEKLPAEEITFHRLVPMEEIRVGSIRRGLAGEGALERRSVKPSAPHGVEIVFDHVVKDGKRMLELVDFSGIRKPGDKNAPREYFQSEQMFGPFTEDRFIILDSYGIDKPCIGDLFTEEEAAKLIKRMRACGKRLHDINAAARARIDDARLERWEAKGRKVVRI